MIINLHLVIKTLTSYNDNYNLYQSSYVAYNWSENFRNEKINALTGTVSPWVTVLNVYT
jgi:hypothetical protein